MEFKDIILKKRDGFELNEEEISFFVKSVTDGSVPDYQISALLMAIYFNKMTKKETVLLTKYMAKSGDMINLSEIDGIKVDKHSTGGVGDKTTLIIAPIVAAAGLKIAKLSGRGLSHTGGTRDKLESITGYKTNISNDEFIENVKKIGISLAGQTNNLAAADKKLYALRDVTCTVEDISLIASSIMSKKIASGADKLLLDVKVGSGAFMKNIYDACELAEAMVEIGKGVGLDTIAILTDMSEPLGNAIGNSLEVLEAIDVLNGKGPKDLYDVCIEISKNMLYLGGLGTEEQCENIAKDMISSKKALNKFIELVSLHKGDVSLITGEKEFEKASKKHEFLADDTGYLQSIDCEKCGVAAMLLGAGRATIDDIIDMSAGILLNKKTGDKVLKGEVLATLFTNDEKKLQNALEKLKTCFEIGKDKPNRNELIIKTVK